MMAFSEMLSAGFLPRWDYNGQLKGAVAVISAEMAKTLSVVYWLY